MILAKRVGISINTLNMYLYRGSIPAADVAVRMAQVLNTTAEYLVLGTHENKVAKNYIPPAIAVKNSALHKSSFRSS